MADGTAAATAYISVEAAGGTTLDGRTYKAYRLGSYGKTDVRVDQDSGDRYAASIPVSSEGVGDRSHVLGIAEFEGDAQAAAAPQANSDESLATLDDNGDTSGSPMARYAAPTTVYHRLFDGTVTSTALDNEDPAISIYTGGNLNYMNNLEVEGSVIVNGNLTNGRGLVAGRANWGMGYTPP